MSTLHEILVVRDDRKLLYKSGFSAESLDVCRVLLHKMSPHRLTRHVIVKAGEVPSSLADYKTMWDE